MPRTSYQAASNPARIRQLWSGAALRAFRKRSPWTQDALAKRLGVSDSTWSRLEQGTQILEATPLAEAERCLGVELGTTARWGEWLARIHGETTGTSAWRFRRAEELIPSLSVTGGASRGT